MSLITNDYEAFLFVKNHLLTQNAKAMNDSDDCQYRGYSDITLNAVREEASLLAREQVEEDDLDTNDLELDLFYDILPSKKCDAMCAVGCLILDKFYDSNMEGEAIDGNDYVIEAVIESNPAWKVTEKSLHMLKKLQKIHDGMIVETWESALSVIGESFDQYNDYDPDKFSELEKAQKEK